MKTLFTFLLLFSSLFGEIKKSDCRYYLTVCTIFRDEAPYLKEWIEFHRLVGVDHFILYNNSSEDNYQKVLSPYIKEGIVELIEWPSTPETYIPAQVDAYNHCIKNSVGVSYWLAPIDTDEFLVPVDQPDLPSFLKHFEKKKGVGSIQVNWQLYGTSNLKKIPKKKLLIESLTLKALQDYNPKDRPANTCFKSIVKPDTIAEYRIHEGDFKKGYRAYPDNKFDQFQQPVQIDHIRINHYWTRAEDFFYDVKINRRMQSRSASYYEVMMQKLIDLNQVEDRIMDRFIPEMRVRMGLD